MNTQENNRLIAEFMGAEGAPMYNPTEWDLYITGILDVDSDHDKAQHFFTLDEMEFNTSWEWLMPVVEKIEYDYMYSVSPTWEHCVIQNAGENSEKLYIETDGQSKIEATYKAVVEFIKYYNKNKL